MKYSFLTPVDKLPVITQKDKEFAEQISQEYNLPLEEVSWLVRDVRSYIEDDFSADIEDSRLRETYRELFSPGSEIRGISIVTNKGSVFIKSSDSMFEQYFKGAIQRIRISFRETMDQEYNFLRGLSARTSFYKIMVFFDQTPLNKMQTNCAIFDFIKYFGIGDPLKTEDEWNKDPTEDRTYRHYKNNRVQSRKQKWINFKL